MNNTTNLTAVAERIIKRRRWLVEWRTNDCTSANFKLDRTAVKLKDGEHPLQTRHDPHRDRLPWQQLNESERPGIQYLAPKSLIVRHVYNCSRTEIFRELRSILANDGSPNDSIRRFKWEIHQRTFQKIFLKKSAELKNWTNFSSNVEQSASNHLKSSISKEIESFDWKASKLFIGTSWQVQANGPKFDGWRGKSIKDRHQVSESDGDCSWHSISTQPIQSECHRLLLYLWQQQMCHEDDKERKPSNNNS